MGAGPRARWRAEVVDIIASGRYLGVFAGGRPAGGALYHDMRQWWHGRQVPMAGVAGVQVGPEHRGRGAGRLLMTALLDQAAARGYLLAALYPATMPLYRSLGWELAGGRHTAVIPARSLRDLVPPDLDRPPGPVPPGPVPPGPVPPGPAGPPPGLRRAGPGDAAAVLAVQARVHQAARDCGPITWDPGTVRRWLADPDAYVYLCEDGVLSYRWHHGNDDLLVEGAQAASAATARAFWSQLGSHAGIAGKVYARVGPADAFWWLTRERDAGLDRRSMWMLRVVDAPAAIAARGFPEAVTAAVRLHVTDVARPANSGLWELAVAAGTGTLAQAGPAPSRGALAVGARGLAALYAGTPVVTLRQAGLAAGGTPAGDAALDAAFAGPAWMLDSF